MFLKDSKTVYTVAALKADLSKFLSLTCTTLSLKKIDIEEYKELTDDGQIVPHKDIYANFSGVLQVDKRSESLHLYYADNGNIIPECNIPDTAIFTKPILDSIHIVKTVTAPPAIAIKSVPKDRPEYATHHQYTHLSFFYYGFNSGAMALLAQSIEYTFLASGSDKTIKSIVFVTLTSACVGAVLFRVSEYVYRKCWKDLNSSVSDEPGNVIE